MHESAAAWKNRIVAHGEKPASQFLAHPLNWRRHPQAQQDALEGALNTVGWVQCVVENRTTGYLVDGHLRVLSAMKRGDETPIPFVEVELTPAEEDLVLATLDPLGAMAEADTTTLATLLSSLSVQDVALGEMLTGLAAASQVPAETVSFTVEERPTCPTCGQKVRKSKDAEA